MLQSPRIKDSLNDNHNVTQKLKTRHKSFLAFLFRQILQFICFKILLANSKYLFFSGG